MPTTRRVSMDEWATRVAAWQRSGKTAVEFCQPPRCWDPQQLRWWRWKLERRGVIVERHDARDAAQARGSAAPTFLRLVTTGEDDGIEITPRGAEDTRCELVLRDGRVLRFGDSVAPARLRALADALEVAP